MTDPGATPESAVDPSAQAVADASALTMADGDRVRPALGMELVEIGPGHALMRMVVRPDHVNGHGVCHGGILFTLADSAAAYAANTWGIDALTASGSIEFLEPVFAGEEVTAAARETGRSGRRAVVDVTVTVQERLVASVRAIATQVRR